jgi:hypothetical protein
MNCLKINDKFSVGSITVFETILKNCHTCLKVVCVENNLIVAFGKQTHEKAYVKAQNSVCGA